MANTVATSAVKYIPPPVASPIAATVHNPEAVVSPLTVPCCENNIVPAPMKPIPLITCAATLDGSSIYPCFPITSPNPYIDTSIAKAAPRHTIMCVLKPAAQSFLSRSSPIMAPKKAASNKRITTSSHCIISKNTSCSCKKGSYEEVHEFTSLQVHELAEKFKV